MGFAKEPQNEKAVERNCVTVTEVKLGGGLGLHTCMGSVKQLRQLEIG